MKKHIAAIFIPVLFFISCNEVAFSEMEYISENTIITAKIDPPVTSPGSKVNISIAVDDGRTVEPVIDITAGNIVFAGKSSVELNIPKDISILFGDQPAKDLKNNGFADVPVEINIRNTKKNALKILRIVKEADAPTNFSVNPEISKIEYEVIGSAQKIEIENSSTVLFSPSNVPEEVSFIPEKKVIDDLIKDEYVFVWYVSGTSRELPVISEFDEKTGEMLVVFRDSDDAPLIGKYKFFAVLKPVKSYLGTEDARYGNDFFTFIIDTDGE